MKVEWLNCRLTFRGDTPAEHEALNAVWVIFGSQVDERPSVDDGSDFELDELQEMNCLDAPKTTDTRN
jgi:hypothetical protein